MKVKGDKERALAYQQRIANQLQEGEYERLVLYATIKLSRFKRFSLSAEDVAHTAVMKTLSGKRHWHSEKSNLSEHLAGCVKSIISNAYTASENWRIDRAINVDADYIDTIASSIDTPEALAERESRITFILEYISIHRIDLVEIATLMYKEEIERPRDLAEVLDLSVKEINQKKFSLKRMLNRSHFLIHYISKNNKELTDIATAILRDKVISAKDLSRCCNIDRKQARTQRYNVLNVVNDIRKGHI